MEVAVFMNRDVKLCSPAETIRQAAVVMRDTDVGSLPVGENDRLVGMITDRDIVVRGLAEGRNGDTPIRDIMSDGIEYCFESDDLEDVAMKMSDLQVRRLPVLNEEKRLVGIVSLGDLSNSGGDREAQALGGVSEPGGQRRA